MTDLTFDPETTAKAEYEFWRAHNDKDKPRLRASLEQWTSELYGIDDAASREAVDHLFKAVAAHDSRDWDAAVENAAKYYEVIRGAAGLDFDPKKAGELEVTWWRIHDELEHETDKTPLVEAFCNLYGELFGLDREDVLRASEMKVRATVEHDRAETDGVSPDFSETHWSLAHTALARTYHALHDAFGTNTRDT